jgi:hypothetical protein
MNPNNHFAHSLEFAKLLEKDKQDALTEPEKEQLSRYLIGLAIYTEKRQMLEKLIEVPDIADMLNEEVPALVTTSVNTPAPVTTSVRTIPIKPFLKKIRMPLGIAASFLIMAVAVWQIAFRDTKSSVEIAQDLIQEYGVVTNKEVRKGVQERADNVQADKTEAAKIHIDKGHYQEAIDILEAIPQQTVEQSFMLGVSYIRHTPPNYNKAIVLFEAILRQPNDAYKRKADWLLALTYICNNQIQEAKSLLETIEKEGDKNAERRDKATKAKELLTKIRNIKNVQ